MKPGGYGDSGADIAWNLRELGVAVTTPVADPDPESATDWTFPDTAAGLDDALRRGARILWANTVLYRGHPLEGVARHDVRVVGQKPRLVHRFDDKAVTNALLRAQGVPVAEAVLVGHRGDGGAIGLDELTDERLASARSSLPVVVKPIRGRGSEGVRKADTLDELRRYAEDLLSARVRVGGDEVPRYGRRLLVERFLPGEELTVSVFPPGRYRIRGREQSSGVHWSLPPVRRFDHDHGIAPYSGVVAVAMNSEPLQDDELCRAEVATLLGHCAVAGRLVGARAPIRIDCRGDDSGDYVLFDLNMKPNMTGPGRPGRQDQDSLTALAARSLRWSYRDLLVNMLNQAWPAQEMS